MSRSASADANIPADVFEAPGAYPHTPGDIGSPVITSHLTLSEAVERRRSEFTKQNATKVKVGSWNVAALNGTEKDVAGWFIGGKGLSDKLSGIAIRARTSEDITNQTSTESDIAVEDPRHQEERRSEKISTIPHNDVTYIPSDDDIGIYALGLQEIVNIGSATEAIRPYSDPYPAKKWKQSVEEGLPPGYQLIAEQQLIGLLLLVYASPDIAPQISHVSTTNVGTGVMGFMGNKGAVTARIVVGETTRMVFINSHLSAGTEKNSLDRRNWDAQQIVSRTKFEPISVPPSLINKGEYIGDEDFAFWFGDLNYRLEDIPGEDVRSLLQVHTKKEYQQPEVSIEKFGSELERPKSPVFMKSTHKEIDSGDAVSERTLADNSSVISASDAYTRTSGQSLDAREDTNNVPDPASLQTTLDSLLPHDQLHQQMQSDKAFYDGWREGPITFLPTYKYDTGSIGMFDSSEKKRGPSWCDRILYRTKADKEKFFLKTQEEAEARRRDRELRERGLDRAADEDESVLFDYDPDTDAADELDSPTAEEGDSFTLVETHSGNKDRIRLDMYTSHQRVLSSDHKPLDAVFSLIYDAVDTEAKARIQAEIARELDKAENEERPVITVVADHSSASSSTPESVDFGHVKYDSPKTRSVTVANTGRVPATFSFAPRGIGSEGEGRAIPKWLSVSFEDRSSGTASLLDGLQEVTIQPGDTISIHLTIRVKDIAMVRRLNENVDSLEDVLILRVQSGRDHFIPLRGEWLRSTFGHSIEKLVKIPEGGIRRLQRQHPHDSSHGEDEVKWSSPKEIFRLTEAIENLIERTLAEWYMIEEGEVTSPPWDNVGWPFENFESTLQDREPIKEDIREALDMDRTLSTLQPLDAGSLAQLEAFAETLLDFLVSLEDGIVPEKLWAGIEVDVVAMEKSKALSENVRLSFLEKLQMMPPYNVSMTLTLMMLNKVTDEIIQALSPFVDENQPRAWKETMRANREQRYSEIFANAVIRVPEAAKEKERRLREQRRKALMGVLIRGLRP